MHTPEFIEEMRLRLENEKTALLGELQSNYPEYGRSEEDNVTEMEDYQVQLSTSNTAKIRLDEVESALKRIHTNMYGVTEDGSDIPEDRLRANPAATTRIV